MKKLLFGLMLTMLIGSAQANSFTWGLLPNSMEDLAGTGNMPIGTTVYLIWDSAGDGFDGYDVGNTVKGDDVLMQASTLGIAGGRATTTITFTDGQSYTTGAGGSVVLNAGQANVNMLLLGTATFGSVLYYNDSTLLSRSMTPASGNPITGYAFADASMAGGLAATPAAAGWTPVPEPTSLALLAIGAAAIGLRRKFRK